MGKGIRNSQAAKLEKKKIKMDKANGNASSNSEFSGFEHLKLDASTKYNLVILEEDMDCRVCAKVTHLWCYKCLLVSYCSEDCRLKDLMRHVRYRMECLSEQAVEIVVNPSDGLPVLRTTRDVKAGKPLFEEYGLFWFPDVGMIPTSQEFEDGRKAVCYGCHEMLSLSWKDSFKCSKCGLSVCGRDCESVTLHAESECNVIHAMKMKAKSERMTLGSHPDPALQYIDVCIVRVLAYFRKKEKLYQWQDLNKLVLTQKFKNMKLNDKSRPGRKGASDFPLSLMYTKGDSSLVTRINDLIQLLVEGVDFMGTKHGLLYLFKSAMRQSCCPNVVQVKVKNFQHLNRGGPLGPRLITKAVTDMLKGTVVTFDFSGSLFASRHDRAQILYKNYFIICACERCDNPTERSTYAGSLCCNFCKKGMFVEPATYISNGCEPPRHSIDYCFKVEWACNFCGYKSSFGDLLRVMNDIEKDYLSMVDDTEVDSIEVERLFVEKYESSRLHPTHSLILHSKFSYLTLCYAKDLWDLGMEVDPFNKPFSDDVQYLDITPFPMQWNIETLKELSKRLEYATNCLENLLRTQQFGYAVIFLKKEIALDKLLLTFNDYAVDNFQVPPVKMKKLISDAYNYTKDALEDYTSFYLGSGRTDFLYNLLQHQKTAIGNLGRLGGSDVKKTAEMLSRYYLGVPLSSFAIDTRFSSEASLSGSQV